jgi:hypothetical protein
MPQDPLSTLGVPAQSAAPTNTQDPLASLGVPVNAAPKQANPADESQMFSATTGAPAPNGQTFAPTHVYDPQTKTIQPVTSPSSVGQTALGEAKSIGKAAIQPIINDAQALVPTNAREHAVVNIGGPGALYAYKTASRLMDSAEGVFKARGEDWDNAKQDFHRAVGEFKQKDYRNAAATVGDLVSDVGGRNAELVHGRELAEGTRKGGDLASPITKDAVDALAALIAEKLPEAAPKVGEVASKVAETAKEVPGKVADAISDSDIIDRFKTKPETPAAQHGTPVRVESPLDGPTVGKQLGGKDLSQEAVDALQDHAGKTIPAGSSAKNVLMRSVEPVSNAINDLVSKANKAAQKAPNFTTSIAQDGAFGEGTLTKDINSLKENLPASDKAKLGADADAVLEDADKILNSHDPAEILEYRRQLGQKIDWDAVEKNPSTPSEVQNAARARVYREISNKIHEEIPETVEIDKQLGPNLELRSHMRSKIGSRVVEDPVAATHEAESEFKKGKTQVETTEHNERAAQYRKRLGIALGVSGLGTIEAIRKIFGL